MAAIPHTFTERNTVQTNNTTTYAAVTGIAQASGNFTVGKKYLIVATAQTGAATTVWTDIRVVHGSTEFEGSLGVVSFLDATQKGTWSYVTVWEAVSSEGVDIQFRGNPSSGASTNTINFVSLLTIQLTDYLTENTDWYFNESTADQALTTGSTWYDGGSITFTPGTASQDWLVLAHATHTRSTTGDNVQSRINLNTGGELVPSRSFVQNTNGAVDAQFLTHVYNLPASSTNLKEQSMNTTGAISTRTYGNIFAMNLSKFAAYMTEYTAADVTYTATAIATPDQLETGTIIPTVTSDVWILAFHGFDKAVASYSNQFRVQVDSSDQPAGQTTAAYVFNVGHTGNSATSEVPTTLSTMLSLSAASHTIELDGAVSNTTSSPSAQQRTLVAVTMELASAGTITPTVGSGALTGQAGRMDHGLITQTMVRLG
jgi:hypothetical protein